MAIVRKIETTTWIHKHYFHVLMITGVFLAGAVISATRFDGSVLNGNTRAPSTRMALAAKISNQVDVPGHGRPIALAADPTRPGVWFLDTSANTESIFFWDPTTSKLKEYPFGRIGNSIPFGMQAAMAVDSSGTVWAGIGTTLLRLDPASGTITRIPLPQVPNDAALVGGPGGGPGGPPRLFDSHAVQALTVDSGGNIVIAMSFTTSVLKYNPQTKTFSEVTLPNGDQANNVSALSNGSVAVATTQINGLDFISPSGAVRHSNIESYVVGCHANVCVTSPDGHDLFTVTESSVPSGTSGNGPSAAKTTVASVRFLLGAKPTLLTDGSIVIPTMVGFDVVNSASGTSQQYSLPSKECSTAGMSNPSGTARPAVVSCQQTMMDYIVDQSGNIWLTSNFGNFSIYEISASTY